MKKVLSLIFGLVVIFSCIITVHAWPVYLGPEALAQLGLNEKFYGESIAVLVCDPFVAYLNGNECREVSYNGLSDLRDRLVKQSFDVRLMKGFQSDYYYLAYYDRFSGKFEGCIGDAGALSCKGEGLSCERVYVLDKCLNDCGYVPKLGDEVRLEYNRYGKCCGVHLVK